MSYTCLQYHIVFATKNRRAVLQAELLPRLVKYIGGIVRGLRGQLLEANGPEDHLHLAAIVPATVCIADFLRDVKGDCSRWLHETFPQLRAFAWQDGYAAFTVSKSAMPEVIDYIRRQREHHEKMTFQEELIALLERHGIEYDERYIVA